MVRTLYLSQSGNMADLETEVALLKSKVSDMEKLHVRLDDAIVRYQKYRTVLIVC